MFQSSDIIGPIPTHQCDIAQALQSSDYKLLQKERRSENGQPVCSDTLLSVLGYASWSSASVLQELTGLTARLQKLHLQDLF